VTKGRTDWFGPTFGMPFIVSVTPDNKPDLVSCCWHCTPSLFLQATHSTPKTTTKMSTDDASRDSPHSRVHTACHCLRWSSPQTIPRMSRQGAEVSIYSFFNVGAGWGWVVKATPGRLTSGKDAVRFVQETRQGLGKYGNPPPPITSQGRRGRIESLYRLSHPHPRASRWLQETRPHIEHSAALWRFLPTKMVDPCCQHLRLPGRVWASFGERFVMFWRLYDRFKGRHVLV